MTVCVTLDHKQDCFDCTLKHLVAEITQLPADYIPRHWFYSCRNQLLALAITTKNSIEIRKALELGMPVSRDRLAWHVQFNGDHNRMIALLEQEGYFVQN